MSEFSSSEFRNALGSFATGVTIVTTLDCEGRDVGLTANSFNSVSLDPPMILWSLARNSRNLEAFRGSSDFAVHILAADQESLSNRFAKSSNEKFAGLALDRGQSGIALLEGCSTRFQCRTVYQYEGGDHIIFVGEVTAFERFDRPPLIFHAGRYALAARTTEPLSAGGQQDQPPGSFSEDFLGYLLGRAHFQLYGRMEESLRRHSIDGYDHFVLSVLGIGDGRTASEIEAVIAYTGVHVTSDRIALLRKRGILLPCSGEPDRLWLSEAGRRMLVELTAAAKAMEEEVLDRLDESEAALLKHLLKRIIHDTNPGLPDPWDSHASNH